MNVSYHSAESHLKNSDLATVGESEPDFLTDITVFISLALEVVPERDLRVEEDHESIFVVFFEGFRGSTIP